MDERKVTSELVSNIDLDDFIFSFALKSSDVFWVRNPDYSIQLYVSPAYEKVWGRSCESLYDNPESWEECLYPEDIPRLEHSILQRDAQIKPGDSFYETYRIIRPDGEIRWINDHSFPIFDKANKHNGFAGICHDVTQEYFRQEELEEANERAEIATQAKLEFVANMSHELRTPLLSIKSGAAGLQRYLNILFDTYEIAVKAGLDVPKIRQQHYTNLPACLERIETEVNYANSIIDILLTNVSLERHDKSDFNLCSIAECIDTALARYPFTNKEERQLLKWKSQDDFIFDGSKLLTVHILFNLIKNALEFTSNMINADVFVWLRKDKDYNFLHFKDNGVGVSEDKLSNLFEKFFTTTGTGLGLSFCKQVMESFGGSITCESIQGEYTEFILRFPKR